MRPSRLPRVAWIAACSAAVAFFTVSGRHAEASGGGLFGTPIEVGAGLDLLLEAPIDDFADTTFEVREFELNIGAPVDPYFYMLATLSYGDGEIDLEEAWVSAILPWNLKLQVGREMTPFGYLNRLHPHDFPQVDAPFVFENLLTDHGLVGDGGHLEWMAPFINPTLTLNAGVYSKMQHSIGRRMAGVPYQLRAQTYAESGCGGHAVLAGVSYLGVVGDRDFAAGRETDPRARGEVKNIYSADLKYRWGVIGRRTGRGLTIGGEFFYVDYERNPDHIVSVEEPTIHPDHDRGFYAYAHWDFDRFWGLGYRFDHSDVLFSRFEDDAREIGHSVYGEWWGTEFSRLRLQYQLRDTRVPGAESDLEHILLLQGTYFIGWHPPHRF